MKDLPLTLTDAVLAPVRLCQITRMDGTVFRIAEAETSIVIDGNTWLPNDAVEISAVKHTIGGDMPSMQIVLAHSVGATFDTAEINGGLFDGADVLLYIADRLNLPASLGTPFFTGSIEPITYSIFGEATFDIRGQSVRDASLIQRYQAQCRTDLFSDLCGLDPDDFDQAGTVGAILNRFNIEVAGLGSPPADGYFNQGVGVTASGIAFEIGNWDLANLKITTYDPVCSLFTVGEGLTLYPGCLKRISEDCHTKFNNALNFQGEPHFLGVAASSASG